VSLIRDYDILKSEPKEVKLGGKTFDLSNVPFEVSLRVYDLLPIMEQIGINKKVDKDSYNMIVSIIAELLHFQDAEVDEKWLRKEMTLKNFNLITQDVLTAIFDDGKKNEEIKEAENETTLL
jgi:hypothetical protein